MNLNRLWIKQPNMIEDEVVSCSYNIFEFYNGVVKGSRIPLEKKLSEYRIARHDSWPSVGEWLEMLYRFESIYYDLTPAFSEMLPAS